MNDLRISMWGDDSFRYWYAHHHIISYTFFSNLFYCSIQYVQTVCASCFFISLDVFSACEADTDVYDGEDMIVLGTSGGGDDLVCNVVIFLGRVDFFRAYRGFDVQSVWISLPLWTFACTFVALTYNPAQFLAPFGLLPCLPQLRRPKPTILLYLDALSSLLRKRKKQCQYFATSIALYLTYLT